MSRGAPSTGASEPRQGRPATSALHFCMVGLVLLNLVFVYLTEVASTSWLVPLILLTVASPILARFKENRLYRTLWNIGVMGFFGVLVTHALNRDMAYVLEDGLILAVLCQVHLLNNLHEQQRPDLLFLNSYLIALITGYISVDMGFAGAFLCYVPFYVIGLQFLSASRPGKPMARADARAVFFDGVERSAVLVAIAMLAFLFWPRDFEREALLVKYIKFEQNSERSEVAFTETLDLKKRSGTSTRREVVLTAELTGGDVRDVPALWRGATLDIVYNGSWKAGRTMSYVEPGATADPIWSMEPESGSAGQSMSRTLSRSPSSGEAEATPAARMQVSRMSSGTKRLFMPPTAMRVELDRVHRRGKLLPSVDGTASYSNGGELRYTLAVADRGASEGAGVLTEEVREKYLQHSKSLHTQSCVGLARDLRKRMGGDPSPRELAREFSTHLAGRYTYRLPGEDGAASTLHEFLTTEAGGHCEFFASALGVMLRAEGIPSRVVTGYRADHWEDASLEVSNLDAHSWVEAYLEGEGWATFDPTPVVDRGSFGPGLFARLGTAAQGIWNRVTGFDAAARADVMAWIKAAPGRAYRAALARPWGTMTALLLMAAAAFGLRERRRRRVPLAVRRMDKALAKVGVERVIGETPREALGRARAALPAEPVASGDPGGDPGVESRPRTLQAAEEAIAAHERDRYALP